MRSQKSIASWQDINPSGWFGMVEKSLCSPRLWLGSNWSKANRLLPCKIWWSQVGGSSRDGQEHLNRPFIFRLHIRIRIWLHSKSPTTLPIIEFLSLFLKKKKKKITFVGLGGICHAACIDQKTISITWFLSKVWTQVINLWFLLPSLSTEHIFHSCRCSGWAESRWCTSIPLLQDSRRVMLLSDSEPYGQPLMTWGMTLGPGFLRKIEFHCLFLFSKKIQRSLKKRAQLGSYFSITNGAENKLLHLPWSWASFSVSRIQL